MSTSSGKALNATFFISFLFAIGYKFRHKVTTFPSNQQQSNPKIIRNVHISEVKKEWLLGFQTLNFTI